MYILKKTKVKNCKEKHIVDGQEVEVVVEVDIKEKPKCLFLFAPWTPAVGIFLSSSLHFITTALHQHQHQLYPHTTSTKYPNLIVETGVSPPPHQLLTALSQPPSSGGPPRF
ncbi:hypothetical protein H2248_004010 [Termitomyces sp. 'cryptogamus']|nr:hypothetical protein H2248_004010 [Termitomyces sp. 'cryptogamus']